MFLDFFAYALAFTLGLGTLMAGFSFFVVALGNTIYLLWKETTAVTTLVGFHRVVVVNALTAGVCFILAFAVSGPALGRAGITQVFAWF